MKNIYYILLSMVIQIAVLFQVTTTTLQVSESYFEGNFEFPVSVTEKKIIGWTKLDNIVSQGFAHNGSKDHVFEEIRDFNGKKVLYAQIIDDDSTLSGTTRFQWSMFLKERLDTLHLSYNIFLSPEIAELSQYPEPFEWFTIFELWNERDQSLTASSPFNGTARWNLSINKEEGVDSPLFWTLDGEKMQPLSEAHDDIFPKQKNKTSPIYVGQWVLFDFKFIKGNPGNIIIKMTPESGQTDVLFDFKGMVMYPERPELSPAFGGQAVNVFKLYTDDKILDWMRSRDKKISAMYDDFKWYK